MKDIVVQPPKPPDIKQPSDEELRSMIATIEAMQQAHCSVDELKKQLGQLLTGSRIVSPRLTGGLPLFRGRLMSTKPVHLSELGAPAPMYVTQQQRCNRAGQPMFYCCSAVNIPLHELNIQLGQRVVLSEWRTTHDLVVNQVGYVPAVFGSLSARRPIPDWVAKHAQTSNLGTQLVASFLAKLFTTRVATCDEHLYTPSIAVTELLLSGDELVSVENYTGFGGLMYPTMAMRADADNFALKLTFAEKHLAFVRADYIFVTGLSHDRTCMSWHGIDTAKSVMPDGKLLWTGRCDLLLPVYLVTRGTWEYLFPKQTGDVSST